MSLTEIHGLSAEDKVTHAAKVAAVRTCKAAATKEIFIAAGGDVALYTTQKDRLLHLFTLLQASDLPPTCREVRIPAACRVHEYALHCICVHMLHSQPGCIHSGWL